MFEQDGEFVAVPYPAWVLQKTTEEIRTEAHRRILMLRAFNGPVHSGELVFDEGERRQLLQGKPVWGRPELTDCNTVDYLTSAFLLLEFQRRQEVVQ